MSDGNVTLSIPSAYVHPNSGVTAGTYNNVTVNAQGHVTAGSNESYAASSHSHNYLPSSGGTITGNLTVSGTATVGGKTVERINSSGTNYIRFESGLQIYYREVSVSSTNGSTYTFPAAFSTTPVGCATVFGNSPNNNIFTVRIDVETTKCKVLTNSGATPASNIGAFVIVVGKWK